MGTNNNSVSTPVSNFIKSDTKRVLIRAYSESAIETTHFINYLGLQVVIDSVYFPAGFTQISGNTTTTDNYIATVNGLLTNQSSADDVHLGVAGTASEISDFYLSFKNVRTLPSSNTILIRADTSCSSTGMNYRPKIYNFSTSS